MVAMRAGLICPDLARGAIVHRPARRRFGRPAGHNVDFHPRRFAVACSQTVSPTGVPTWPIGKCHGYILVDPMP